MKLVWILLAGCCWVPVAGGNVRDTPWCFYPADTSEGYKLDSETSTDMGYVVLYDAASITVIMYYQVQVCITCF